MVKWLPGSRKIGQSVSVIALLIGVSANPSFAKDPFRTNNPRPIGDKTEAAFRAVFEKGNYADAKAYLDKAEAGEPLAHTLRASLAYANWQGEPDAQKKQGFLGEFKNYANQTRSTAEQLTKSDPLRGNIYQAVGNFLEGLYIVGTDGMVRGTPQALGKLQQAFKYLDEAEKISPQDPELNLLKGFMDLMLSINISLPLSSPNEAIQRLERFAQPPYLSYRGLALGYRDLKQFDKALQAVDRAISAAPDNPELSYLKAQILVGQKQDQASLPFFQKALSKKNQLPGVTVSQIQRELNKAKGRLNGR